MQKSFIADLSAAAFMMVGAIPAQAQLVASTIPAVLSICPDNAATPCVPAVQSFISQQAAGSQRDADLVALVVQLAGVAQNPSTTQPMCLDIADGIRAAGEAVQDGAQAQEIQNIADALCAGGATTAATPERKTPQSINSSSPKAPQPPSEVLCCSGGQEFGFLNLLKFEGDVVQVASVGTLLVATCPQPPCYEPR